MTITSSWTCFVSAFISLSKNCHSSMETGFSCHHFNLLFHTPFTVFLSSSPLKHTAVIVMANPECESRFHFPFPLFHCFLFAIVSFDFSTVPTLHKTTSNQPSTLLLHCVVTDFSFLFFSLCCVLLFHCHSSALSHVSQ